MVRVKEIAIWAFVVVIVGFGFWGLSKTGIFNNILNIPEFIIPTSNVSFSLGQEFKLDKTQTGILKESNTSIRIIKFINDPCPKGTQCFWSGQAVEYELISDNQIYRSSLGSLTNSPFIVTITSTDYKTYATFILKKR